MRGKYNHKIVFKKRFSLVEREEIVDKAHRCLWVSSGGPGYEYLTEKRKLSDSVIRDFQLGYIPDFVQHQLRGRIILPVFDPTGNLIAIGSRAINDRFKKLPVYWHESYEKPYYLYGADLARKYMRKYQFAIVCEGQFDVLQLCTHGVRNVVGLCGNKMSDVQMSVIHRYCSDVVLLLDTDANQAGQMGAAKVAAKNKVLISYKHSRYNDIVSFPAPIRHTGGFCSYSRSRSIISVTFPQNADPDSFVREHGIEELKKIVRGKLHELRSRTSRC